MAFRLFLAFLRRDVLIQFSYRFEFLVNVLAILFSVATFYFVSRLIGTASEPNLIAYGGAYFPFVLTGLAFSAYQNLGLRAFSRSLREEQYLGTLELILSAPIRLPAFLAASVQWSYLVTTVEVVLHFLAASLLFGLRLPNANFFPALLALCLTLTCFLGLGILSAAFILKFKRGDPAAWFVGAISELLSGVYFPVAILPSWLRRFSSFVPMTPALEALRRTLLAGASISQVAPELLSLTAFTLVLVPSGFFCFHKAWMSAKREGSLGHY